MPAHPKPAPKAKKPGAMRRAKPRPAPIAANLAQAKAEKALDAKRAAKVSAPAAAGSKTDLIVAMLKAGTGATSKQLEAATGWAPHSVRGLLGTLRKRGVNVVSTKVPKQPTVYHIAAGVAVDVI